MTNTQKKKWTLMFFLASDNTLSPSTLSQLKAIKAAGFQSDTNVLVYFDPNEKGAPTRVFEINKDAAQSSASTGDPDASLVSVLTRDNIDPTTITGPPGSQSQQFGTSLQQAADQLNASQALANFLGFCRESYPADHYMLFLLGHGLVVGRDAFLPDDNPESAIGLKTLGQILTTFSTDIRGQGVLELIAMHSCSMSGIEIAYELKGTANYMLASQGISFVGSWPYRQLLTKIFKAVQKSGDNVDVSELMKSLQSLCIQYSADFMYAGYSADMCLCSLQAEPIQTLTRPIQKLSEALTNGLKDRRCRELIVLAHWKSQSYWQETYSDLYDFCLCLRRLSDQPKGDPQDQRRQTFDRRAYDIKRIAIIDACNGVMAKLRPQSGSQMDGPIVSADFIGPDCQYSHGLSIYFPWSDPVADANDHVIENYKDYEFTKVVGPKYWLEFLNTYFKDTQREDRLTEDHKYGDENVTYQTDPDYMKALAAARSSFSRAVAANSNNFMSTSALEGKVSPPDSGGGACTCASTRNYSRDFSMSPGVSTVFGGAKPKSSSAGGAGPVSPPGP